MHAASHQRRQEDRRSEAQLGAAQRDPTAWRTRLRLPVVSAAIIVLACSAGAFGFVWQWEDSLARSKLASVARNHIVALQNGLNDYLAKLDAVRGLIEANNAVTRQQFRIFTGRMLEKEAAIQNFSWVPRVRRAERAAFEQAATRDGIPNYGIKSIADDGRIVPSPERDEYLPIFYSSVAKTTSPIYGIDIGNQPAIRKRLDRARDENVLSVVPDFILHSVAGNVHGFLFSLPVYRAGLPHDTVETRRANLLGFAHGALLTGVAFEHIITTSTSPAGLDLYLFPSDAGAATPPLHAHSSRLGAEPAEAESFAVATAGRHVDGVLTAGDAHWLVIATPVPGGPLQIDHDRAWLVLAASLLVGTIALFHIHTSSRQARRLLRANEQISELAQTDPVTGLLNRRAFTARLNAAFAACRRGAPSFALLYFDLDYFKDVNDTLGHPVGDCVLRQVAERVQGAVRVTDAVARFGGDEFALLQANVSEAQPEAVARKVNELLARPFIIDGNDVRVTCSIGISLYRPDIATPDTLMIESDLALYRAKEDGRNCFRFHSAELDHEVHERVTVSAELRTAIDRGQLRLFYQPQVDLATNRIIGIEALVRWQHPRRGLIGPNNFIAIAERTGSIIPLGQWVFQEACRQLHIWQKMGVHTGTVAVNVSAVQIKSHADFDRFIATTLTRWQIDPRHIEIELTESVLMDVTEQCSHVFEQLSKLGVRTAIDDFGSGYSSLSYLTSNPVSRLKIAQDLVFGVPSDVRSATVVRAAVRLARELGLACVAEGVETRAQADFLISTGCEAAQGYYFGAPVSADEMTLRLEQENPGRKPTGPRLAVVSG